MKKLFVWISILVLLVAHQDYWQWDRSDLVYGFIPGNMAYHIGLSCVTAIVWILICAGCWPKDLEAQVNDVDGQVAGGKTK